MDHYSFTDPGGMEGWVGLVGWPISRRLTHEVVTRQPWIRRRSGKVRQLQTDVLTTESRRQPSTSTSEQVQYHQNSGYVGEIWKLCLSLKFRFVVWDFIGLTTGQNGNLYVRIWSWSGVWFFSDHKMEMRFCHLIKLSQMCAKLLLPQYSPQCVHWNCC